jgi:hypothetical protein
MYNNALYVKILVVSFLFKMVRSDTMFHFTDFELSFSIHLQASAMKQENIEIGWDILLSGVK